jgi:hypothetical protein
MMVARSDEAKELLVTGCRVVCTWSGELRIASASTSVLGGVRNLRGATLLKSVSKRPKRGRGGRSGMLLPFGHSGADPERSRVPIGMTPTSALEKELDCDDGRENWIMESLMLRRACIVGAAGVLRGKFVASSPNLSWSGDGG